MPGDDTTVHTNNALNRLLDEYMDKRVVRDVHGGVEVSKTMLEQRFDLIFCTGGTFIGKIVAAAAAKTLTPTILELGGKSPAIIDETCDLKVSARRIAWGSFINSGQTCLRPDYVLVSSKIGDRFVALLEKSLRSFFGDDALQSEDYGRLVNTRQFDRIAAMIEQDKRHIAYGGSTNATEQYVEPTLLNFKNDIHAFTNAASMSQEVFGPLLPIYYWMTVSTSSIAVRGLWVSTCAPRAPRTATESFAKPPQAAFASTTPLSNLPTPVCRSVVSVIRAWARTTGSTRSMPLATRRV